jgi:hypothetical protein
MWDVVSHFAATPAGRVNPRVGYRSCYLLRTPTMTRWTPGRRHASGRATHPGCHSEPRTDDRRELPTLDSTSHSDRTGSQRQRPSPSLELGRRSSEGQPRYWAQLKPDTPNNSETLRQMAIKATGMRQRLCWKGPFQIGLSRIVSARALLVV